MVVESVLLVFDFVSSIVSMSLPRVLFVSIKSLVNTYLRNTFIFILKSGDERA